MMIREFVYLNDYPAVKQLWEHAGAGVQLRRSDEPDELRKKLERDPDLFLVAEEDGALIGSILGGFDGRRGLLYHLAVAGSHRQRGIGDALMQEIEKRMRAKGCLKCYLLVTKENHPAITFYEKRGWNEMTNVKLYGKDL